MKKNQPGCPCCGGCDAYVEVTVTCGGTPTSGETVELYTAGGVLVDSCTTDGIGECVLTAPAAGTYEVRWRDASIEVVLACDEVAEVAFAGQSCVGFNSGTPATRTLSTPHGDVTLTWSASGNAYRGTGSIDVRTNCTLTCTGGSTLSCQCTGPDATVTIPVYYTVTCGGIVTPQLTLRMFVPSCNPVTLLLVVPISCGPSAQPWAPLRSPDVYQVDQDAIDFGTCGIPAGASLEFALDYTDLGGGPSVVTLSA